MTGAQVDRRRRVFVGVITTAAVLAVAHQPIDFTSAQARADSPTSVTGAPSSVSVGSDGPTGHTAADPGTYEVRGRGTVEARRANSPGCFEDEAAVVAVDRNPAHGLTWVCIPLDDL